MRIVNSKAQSREVGLCDTCGALYTCAQKNSSLNQFLKTLTQEESDNQQFKTIYRKNFMNIYPRSALKTDTFFALVMWMIRLQVFPRWNLAISVAFFLRHGKGVKKHVPCAETK